MSGIGLLQTTYLIALAPLVAFVLILSFRKYVGMDGAWIGVLAAFYSFVHATLISIGIYKGSIELPQIGLQGHYFEAFRTWFTVGGFDFRIGVLIDGLSAMMLVVVTLVSFLVQLYSISYMHGHQRFGRYFAYVNLFTFSMLLIVMGNNLMQFFIGWELVGLCSYLLIGFDFERDAAAYAGRKAFLTTKVGDLGFYIGLLIIFNFLGTFNIPQLFENIQTLTYPTWVLVSVPLLLFFGAMGKSAQIGLHVWLPDAMEGPTPASALIHAATMVAAGVYMVARIFFMYEAAPISMEVVAWVGALTAFFAATMGLVAADIKRVLAFSTVSQLGFMMAALGCGGYVAGMFHLTTHAFFKALLFLCAGSVIHAVHTNDMWQMGGLKTKMPITAITYLLATLAIAGFPFLSGFFSKEEILMAAIHHNPAIFVILVLAAMLTSFYMFRTFYLTFLGSPRNQEKYQHAHESPSLMTIPLMVLGFLSVVSGAFFVYHHNLGKWIHWGEPMAHHNQALVMGISIAVFVLGWLAASIIYSSKSPKYEKLGQKLSIPHAILNARYKVDELYLWFIGNVYHPIARWCDNVDYNFLDQKIVDGVGLGGKRFSWLSRIFDDGFVDQILIDGNGAILNRVSGVLKRIQSGLAQSYLFWMALGLISMFVWVAASYK